MPRISGGVVELCRNTKLTLISALLPPYFSQAQNGKLEKTSSRHHVQYSRDVIARLGARANNLKVNLIT
jgi:hypothetical protein